MIKTFRNAYGKKYEKDLLTREEIEKIFNNFSYQDIVQKAMSGWVESFFDGTAELNCSSGKLVSGSYSQGAGVIEGAHYIELYRIGRNWEFESDDPEEEMTESAIYDSTVGDQIEENFRNGLREVYDTQKKEEES